MDYINKMIRDVTYALTYEPMYAADRKLAEVLLEQLKCV